jgi:predicted nucleotidyltransferase
MNLPYHSEIEAIVQQTLAGHCYAVYLFGSQADGTATTTSDIDLGILSEESLTEPLSLMREALAESHIPYNVDVVNLAETSPSFRKAVLKDGVLLWKN